MSNYILAPEEVILYEDKVTSKNYKGNLLLTLTSQKIVFEKEKGILKKIRELVDCIELSSVKFYNDTVQVKQKSANVDIQTTKVNLILTFDSGVKAKKFAGKLIDAVTNTTFAQRVSDKTKKAFDLVDDTLEIDTRGAIKGVIQNGITGLLFNGIDKKE